MKSKSSTNASLPLEGLLNIAKRHAPIAPGCVVVLFYSRFRCQQNDEVRIAGNEAAVAEQAFEFSEIVEVHYRAGACPPAYPSEPRKNSPGSSQKLFDPDLRILLWQGGDFHAF